jgi:hypothetical protein
MVLVQLDSPAEGFEKVVPVGTTKLQQAYGMQI